MTDDKEARLFFSVCIPPVCHQLHCNLDAMATESHGPLCRSHGGPHSVHIVSHHICRDRGVHDRTQRTHDMQHRHNKTRHLKNTLTQCLWNIIRSDEQHDGKKNCTIWIVQSNSTKKKKKSAILPFCLECFYSNNEGFSLCTRSDLWVSPAV